MRPDSAPSTTVNPIAPTDADRRRAGRRYEDLTLDQQIAITRAGVEFGRARSVEQTTQALAEVCAVLAPEWETSVVAIDSQGTAVIENATSQAVRVLAELELGGGSSLPEALAATGGGVSTATERVAAIAGFDTVNALALDADEQIEGVLYLFARSNDEGLRHDLIVALASAAGNSLAAIKAREKANVLAIQLQGALDSRVVIEQAKGMIAARLMVAPDEAFELLRTYARDRCMKVHDFARDIISGKASTLALRERAGRKHSAPARPRYLSTQTRPVLSHV